MLQLIRSGQWFQISWPVKRHTLDFNIEGLPSFSSVVEVCLAPMASMTLSSTITLCITLYSHIHYSWQGIDSTRPPHGFYKCIYDLYCKHVLLFVSAISSNSHAVWYRPLPPSSVSFIAIHCCPTFYVWNALTWLSSVIYAWSMSGIGFSVHIFSHPSWCHRLDDPHRDTSRYSYRGD